MRLKYSLMVLALTGLLSGATLTDSLWYLVRGGANADESWAVTTDSAGNIYWATHQTVAHPWPSVQLYKLRPDTSPIWNIRWGDSLGVMCYVVAVREPYVYFAGTIWSNTADMIVVCCSTANGHEAWRWTWDQGYGYEEVDGLVIDSTGVYVAGWTMAANNQLDLAVARLNLNGQQQWLRTFGTSNWDEANGQIVIDAQNVYVCGRYNAPSSLFGGDALLVAFRKANGDTVWHRTWGGTGMDDAFGMIGDSSGLYVVGITNSFGNGTQIFLLKYDFTGAPVWDTIWGGAGEDLARAVTIGPDGYLYVGGKSTSYGAESTDALLLKFSKSGDFQWYRLWGGPRDDETHGITAAGNYLYIAGETSSFGSGANDALLIRAGLDGTFPAGVTETPGPATLPAVPCRQLLLSGPQLRISATLCAPGRVSAMLFDATGRRQAGRFSWSLPAGPQQLRIELPDLAPGVYLLQVSTPDGASVCRLVQAR